MTVPCHQMPLSAIAACYPYDQPVPALLMESGHVYNFITFYSILPYCTYAHSPTRCIRCGFDATSSTTSPRTIPPSIIQFLVPVVYQPQNVVALQGHTYRLVLHMGGHKQAVFRHNAQTCPVALANTVSSANQVTPPTYAK